MICLLVIAQIWQCTKWFVKFPVPHFTKSIIHKNIFFSSNHKIKAINISLRNQAEMRWLWQLKINEKQMKKLEIKNWNRLGIKLNLNYAPEAIRFMHAIKYAKIAPKNVWMAETSRVKWWRAHKPSDVLFKTNCMAQFLRNYSQ